MSNDELDNLVDKMLDQTGLFEPEEDMLVVKDKIENKRKEMIEKEKDSIDRGDNDTPRHEEEWIPPSFESHAAPKEEEKTPEEKDYSSDFSRIQKELEDESLSQEKREELLVERKKILEDPNVQKLIDQAKKEADLEYKRSVKDGDKLKDYRRRLIDEAEKVEESDELNSSIKAAVYREIDLSVFVRSAEADPVFSSKAKETEEYKKLHLIGFISEAEKIAEAGPEINYVDDNWFLSDNEWTQVEEATDKDTNLRNLTALSLVRGKVSSTLPEDRNVDFWREQRDFITNYIKNTSTTDTERASKKVYFQKYLDRIEGFLETKKEPEKREDKKVTAGDFSAQAETYLAEAAKYAKKQAELSEKEVRDGKYNFFETLYYQSSPPRQIPNESIWFPELSESERIMLSSHRKILELLEMKRGGSKDRPAKSEEFIANYNLSRKEMEAMGKIEGFRMSLVTQMKDFFKMDELDTGYGKGPMVLRLNDEKTIYIPRHTSDKGAPADGMYSAKDVLGDVSNGLFQDYKDNLVKEMAEYFRKNPEKIGLGLSDDDFSKKDFDAAEIAAKAYVGMSWNLLSVGLAVESADVDRNAAVISDWAFTGKWRRLIHPYAEAKSKIIDHEGETVGTEDIVFGNLGDWATERCRHDPDFREDLKNFKKGRRYFLKTTIGSFFDHVQYKDGKTMAQALMDDSVSERVDGSRSLRTINDTQYNALTFRNLSNEDLGFFYKIKLDSVFKTQSLVTSSEPAKDFELQLKKREFVKELVTLEQVENKLKDPTGKDNRVDQVFAAIYKPEEIEDFVIAGIAGLGNGFLKYSRHKGKTFEMLASGGDYDSYMQRLLADGEVAIALGAKPSDRSEVLKINKKIMKRLSAIDPDAFLKKRLVRDRLKLRKSIIYEQDLTTRSKIRAIINRLLNF